MVKISLIAIIWVWHCVAYGQLSVHSPYHIPYISTFVTPHNHQNYDEMVDQLLERISPFQGAIFVKMKKLEAIAANLAKQLKDTTAKLEKNISDLKDELNTKATKDDLAKKADQSELVKTNTELQTKATKDDLAKKADQLKLDETNSELKTISTNLETATSNLALTMTELSSTKSAVSDLTKMLNARTSEIVDIGQMPTSCSDLERMGHKLSGFFSVKGSVRMEMIYCNFNPNQNEKQKWIGYADVKSAPVQFYVQRSSSITNIVTKIPFQMAPVNEGNAMDFASGIFTAPQPGIYFFFFSGLASFPSSSIQSVLTVGLYLNGRLIVLGSVEDANTVNLQNDQVTIQSTLNLKSGDQVWLGIYEMSEGVFLADDSNGHFTHFTGFML